MEKVQRPARQLQDKDSQLQKLHHKYDQLQDSFSELCSENKTLTSNISAGKSHTKKNKKQERELKLAREKAPIEDKLFAHNVKNNLGL